MARWRLTDKHYLNIEGTKWEYTENSRTTGKPVRKVFNVPMYLNPEDPADWNWKHDKDSGEIIVCYAGKGLEKDYVFVGEPQPTIDMLPLDAEAAAISAKINTNQFAQNTLAEGGMTGALLEALGEKLAEATTAATQNNGNANMDKLLETMNAMMQQNATLIATLAANMAAPAQAPRRP